MDSSSRSGHIVRYEEEVGVIRQLALQEAEQSSYKADFSESLASCRVFQCSLEIVFLDPLLSFGKGEK